jgi:hypothetical protein
MEKKKTTKTPDYTRRAIANYQLKFDRVNINLEKGLKDRIKAATGESLNACVNRLIREELARIEKSSGES